MKKQLFYFVYLCAFFFSFTSNHIAALEPSLYINNNIFLYLEIDSPKISIPKLQQLFYSMMNRKKAESEWKEFEELFVEDYGINLLSLDSLAVNGFSTSSPIGIAIRYIPQKVQDKIVYLRYMTLVLPSDDTDKSYNFFYKKYLSGNQIEYNSGNLPKSREVEKNKLLLLQIDKLPVYILRTSDAVIISEDFDYIKNIRLTRLKSINDNTNFQLFKSYLRENKNFADQIAFFYVNTENSEFPFRQNPRLILDNVLMDNKVIQEMAENCKYFGGAIRINSSGINTSMDYFFPDHYLDDKNYYLGRFLDFKNENYFPDYVLGSPFSYAKIQSNFSATVEDPETGSINSRKNIAKFIAGLLDTNSVEIPPDIEFLSKDNIGLYIQEIPSFKFFNKFYLWKGYFCVNYNPQYLPVFEKFMNNLAQESQTKEKNYTIKFNNIPNRKLWEITIKKFIKRYDKKKDEVVTDEKIFKFFISADSQQIVLTHNADFLSHKQASGLMPISRKVDSENNAENQILFVYIDMKKLLKYVDEGSFALPLKNYFSYFEKGRSLIFKINRRDNMLNEELNLNIDK